MPATPYHWIEEYLAGNRQQSHQARTTRYRSIIQIILEEYDGSSLRWYEWIDRFRALIHDTDLGEGVKLAILKKKIERSVHPHCDRDWRRRICLPRSSEAIEIAIWTSRRDPDCPSEGDRRLELGRRVVPFCIFAQRIRNHLLS